MKRGDKVVIDNDPAFRGVIREVYPEGSTSYAFPHVRLDVVGGDRNIAVNLSRVSKSR